MTGDEFSFLDLLDNEERVRLVAEFGELEAEGQVIAELARLRGFERAKAWKSHASRDVGHEWARREHFERSLEVWPWGPAIRTLDLQWITTLRVARRYFGRQGRDAERDHDARFHACMLLHRRALLVTAEIRALLRGGLASGAMARWRTLHEVAIVGMLLQQGDQDLATRYIEHEDIAKAARLKEMLKAGPKFTEQLPSDAEMAELFGRSKRLRQKYGPKFEGVYGWASKALGVDTPVLGDLERRLEMGHWHPYVSLAHASVHAGADAMYYDLGAPDDWDAPPIGGSLYGLEEPGQCTALSLSFASLAWLTIRPDIDALTDLEALRIIGEQVQEAFIRAASEVKNSESLAKLERSLRRTTRLTDPLVPDDTTVDSAHRAE